MIYYYCKLLSGRFVLAEVSANKRSILRGSIGSALATLMARFLGLFRVMLEASVLGGGGLATTWQVAFLIPNLFRRRSEEHTSELQSR